MKKLQRSSQSGGLLLLIMGILLSKSVVAQSVTPRLFLYEGGKISHLTSPRAIPTKQSVPQLYVEPRSDDTSVVQAQSSSLH